MRPDMPPPGAKIEVIIYGDCETGADVTQISLTVCSLYKGKTFSAIRTPIIVNLPHPTLARHIETGAPVLDVNKTHMISSLLEGVLLAVRESATTSQYEIMSAPLVDVQSISPMLAHLAQQAMMKMARERRTN